MDSRFWNRFKESRDDWEAFILTVAGREFIAASRFSSGSLDMISPDGKGVFHCSQIDFFLGIAVSGGKTKIIKPKGDDPEGSLVSSVSGFPGPIFYWAYGILTPAGRKETLRSLGSFLPGVERPFSTCVANSSNSSLTSPRFSLRRFFLSPGSISKSNN